MSTIENNNKKNKATSANSPSGTHVERAKQDNRIDSKLCSWCATHYEYLIFVVEQNLVVIDALVSAVTLPECGNSNVTVGLSRAEVRISDTYSQSTEQMV